MIVESNYNSNAGLREKRQAARTEKGVGEKGLTVV